MRTTQTKTKNASLDSMLELGAALFILLGPVSVSRFGTSWGLYGMFALLSIFLCARLICGGKLHVGISASITVALGVYAVICTAFAQNMYRHIRLIFLIFSAAEIMLLAADYFSLEAEKKIGGRLSYMVIFSAEILAAVNIIYWAVGLKFSFTEALSAGMGQNDFIGIFMFAALWCAVKTYSEEKKKNGFLLWLCIPMIFVLIMSKSPLTWFFGSVFAALYLWKKKKRLSCALFGCVGIGTGIYFIVRLASTRNTALFDAVLTAFKYPLGLGGGGFVSMQGSLQSAYYKVASVGSGGELISAFGIVGLIAVIVFLGCQVYLTFKHKKWFNAFAALLSVYAFFAAMSQSQAAVLLFVCVCVYGEWRLGKTAAVKLNGAVSAAVAVVAAAAVIYGGVLATGEVFRSIGRTYLLTDEERAAQSLETAANINVFDGEGCYDAANAYRYLFEEDGEKESFVKAEYEIKRAIDREKNNAFYYAEYARILSRGGDYLAATEQGEKAVSLAPLSDEFKVLLSGDLYKLMESYERGSVDAQRCYLRILECGEQVADMENKKVINDYADKAQPYTRIDFYENEEELGE